MGNVLDMDLTGVHFHLDFQSDVTVVDRECPYREKLVSCIIQQAGTVGALYDVRMVRINDVDEGTELVIVNNMEVTADLMLRGTGKKMLIFTDLDNPLYDICSTAELKDLGGKVQLVYNQ